MSRQQTIEDRVVLAFLERLVDDRTHGRQQHLDDYLRLFPGHDERLRSEWERLHAEGPDAGEPVRRLGPYRLLEVLGRGGQGVVYRAIDERIGRVVALKLLAGVTLDGELPARVRRELEAIARLDHPALGIVYEAGEHGGQVFIAMRHVPGRSLADHIADWVADADTYDTRAGRNWRRTALGWTETLARALHSAHAVGVIHRDVKPANVMIHESGEPVLLDFGLARSDDSSLDTLTVSGELIGTTAYMAPERLGGRGLIDRRIDVWSLGVILYELLTGRRPFEAGSPDELSRMIRTEEPLAPRRLERTLSRDAAVVLNRALEKDPDRRYQTAADFAEELSRLQAGRPILARPVSPLGRLRRWASRHPARAGLGLALIAALVATSWAAVRFADLAERERGARLAAETLLVRSGAEQAELLSLSGLPGRRWQMLELLSDAATRRAALPSPLPAELPDLVRLRGLATEALLLHDARHQRAIQRSNYGSGTFGPDGETLVLSWLSPDFRSFGIRILDIASGTERARYAESDHISRGFAVTVDAGAERFATVRRDVLSVVLWDAHDGSRLADLDLPVELEPETIQSTWNLAFLPGDRQLVAVSSPKEALSDPGVRPTAPHGWVIWDLPGGTPRAWSASTPDAHTWLSLSDDGSHLAVPDGVAGVHLIALDDFNGRTVELPDEVMLAAIGNGEQPEIVAVVRPAEGDSDVLVRVANDSRLLARREFGERIFELGRMRISPDGRWLAFAGDGGSVHVASTLDLAVCVTIPPATTRDVQDLLFVDGGRVLLTHSESAGTDAWELALDAVPQQGLPLEVSGPLTISPDGRWLACGSAREGGGVLLWDLANARPGPSLSPPQETREPSLLAFDEPGRQLAASDGRAVWIWTLDGAATPRAPEGQPRSSGAPVVDMGFDRDGVLLVLRSEPGRPAMLARPGKGDARTLPDDTAQAWLRLDGPRQRILAISSEEARGREILSRGPLRLHDLERQTHTDLAGIPVDVLRKVFQWSFSNDGDQLAAQVFVSTDAARASPGGPTAPAVVVMLWDLPGGELRWSRPFDDRARYARSAVHPAGSLVAVVRGDGRLALLDGEDGSELLSWRSHDHSLQALHFVGDGSRLLSRDTSGRLKLWDLASLEERLGAIGLGF